MVLSLPRLRLPRVPTLLERVAEAARKLEETESARAHAREDLRAAILAARDEGIPLAAIGRAAGLSRQRVRQIVQPR
jgi:DNA-directed RNA polymerase sigma subunit (sigma70/sigma32)